MALREYVVTLHSYEDLDDFYNDMESPGGNLYIPNRAVQITNKRPISRNTEFLLTDEEAEILRDDPRVLAVDLTLKERGLKFTPSYIQTSSFWSKTNTVSSPFLNWGLLRTFEGTQRSNWGSNGTGNVSGTINITSSGKNVDVVIVDGHINPLHPEFAVNSDGTGGSRVIQYNWFQHNLEVSNTAPGTYVYTPYVDPSYPDNNLDGISDRTDDNDHGCHVAGTAVGNTQGWARDANIYNISPYGTNPSYVSNFIDYIRHWHKIKPINPITGIKNPTITNHSYGVAYPVDILTITQFYYRGVLYNPPYTDAQLLNFGLNVSGGVATVVLRLSTAEEQDYIDAMNEGIIMVGAAGNESTKVDNFASDFSNDYNNFFYASGYVWFYNRGSVSAIPGMICVGAISSLTDESKGTYSNCGPRVDVYAPGTLIQSSVNSDAGVEVADPRNAAYYQTKKLGTSMASPQVAGILACLAEQWPTMTQSQAMEYVVNNSKSNQITNSGGGYSDFASLQGSPNRYLYYVAERKTNGQIYPRPNYGNRPSSGAVFPRTRIFRYGK